MIMNMKKVRNFGEIELWLEIIKIIKIIGMIINGI